MAKAETVVIDGEVVVADDTAKPRNAVATTGAPRPPVASKTDPMAIIAAAVKNNAPVEVIERLVALQERVMTFEARRAFNQAIADARGEIPVIVKNRTVKFDSKRAGAASTDYAHEDLAQIATQIDPVLAKFGLSYRFKSRQNGNHLTVTCILSHRDGHVEDAGELGMHNDTSGNKGEAQGIGSAATYLERYTLKLSLGLAAAEDDDARKAREIEAKSKQPPVPSAGASPSSTQQQRPVEKRPPYPIPTEGMKFPGWAKLYVEHVRTSDTVAELEAWDKANDGALQYMLDHDQTVYAEVDRAVGIHKEHLIAKQRRTGRTDPISTGPQEPEEKRPAEIPDAEEDPDDFVRWATGLLTGAVSPEDADRRFAEIEKWWTDLLPPDRNDILGAHKQVYAKFEG